MTDTAPGAIAIDYDKLAEAMDRRRSLVPVAAVGPADVDLGPYPHTFRDGEFVPEESGENNTDPIARELAGLEPLGKAEPLAAVPT